MKTGNSDFLLASIVLFVLLAACGIASSASPAGAKCHSQDPQPGVADACTCAIGPVSLQAGNCDIKINEFEDWREEYIDWGNDDGAMLRVIVITPKRARSFKGYLAWWRHGHKCTAGERRQLAAPTRFQAPPGAGLAVIPPQVTWSGCCVVSECYIARAVAVGNQVVELHVDGGLGYRGPAAEQVFAAFLGRIHLSDTTPPRYQSEMRSS